MRTSKIAALAAATLLVFAACDDNGDSDSAVTPLPENTEAPALATPMPESDGDDTDQ